MEPEFKRGYNPKIAAAAPYAPEQILILAIISRQQTPVGGHHVRADDVVDSQSILAMQVAPAASERESRHADGWDYTLSRGQTERLRLSVELPQLDTRLGARGLPAGIDAYAFHQGQIDHQAPVTNRLSGDAVASASHRN
jgi:hypothetical protein